MKATEQNIYFLIEMTEELKNEAVRYELFTVAAELRDAINILKGYEKEIFIRKAFENKEV